MENNMDNKGYIYIGYDQKGLFKIGMTENVQKRQKQIQNMNPNFYMFLAYKVDSPAVAEVTIHERFKEKRVVGEWFELTAEDILWIVDKYLEPDIERPSLESVRMSWEHAKGKEE
jgi:Meiotically up-regulated gene 113